MDAGLIHVWIKERKTNKPDKTSVQLISLFICLPCIVLYRYLLNLLWATQVNCHKYLFVKASRSTCTCSIPLWKLDFCMLLQANSCQHVNGSWTPVTVSVVPCWHLALLTLCPSQGVTCRYSAWLPFGVMSAKQRMKRSTKNYYQN